MAAVSSESELANSILVMHLLKELEPMGSLKSSEYFCNLNARDLHYFSLSIDITKLIKYVICAVQKPVFMLSRRLTVDQKIEL